MGEQNGPQEIRVGFEGRTYVWAGNGWYEATTFMEPPKAVQNQLNLMAESQLEAQDIELGSPTLLLDRARSARDADQLLRAEKLARRALDLDPGHLGAAAILCSVLRSLGRAEEALRETESNARTGYLPLTTSRAAALCDLERWEEAKRVLGRVFAAGGGPEAFAVLHRIKAARPDLYPKKRLK